MPRVPNPGPRPTIAQLRREFAEAHESELLSRAVTAAGMGFSQSWLEMAATRGGGPAYFKCARRVLYRKSDTLAWMREKARRVQSTSEYEPNP